MLPTRYLLATLAAAASLFGQAEVVFSGLQTPQRLILTPRGNFLVSESNTDSNSGRISFITRAGARRSLIEALPSGTDQNGGFSGPSALVPGVRSSAPTLTKTQIDLLTGRSRGRATALPLLVFRTPTFAGERPSHPAAVPSPEMGSFRTEK